VEGVTDLDVVEYCVVWAFGELEMCMWLSELCGSSPRAQLLGLGIPATAKEWHIICNWG